MTTDVNQSVTSGVRPGLRLKKARETLNLSLDDVAKHLKSNKKIIEALEKEDVPNLPQSIYVSGYLRSYANLVSLPARDILETYPNLGVADPILPKFKSTTNSAKFGNTGTLVTRKFNFNSILIAVILVTIVGLGGWFYTQIFSQNFFQDFSQDSLEDSLEDSSQDSLQGSLQDSSQGSSQENGSLSSSTAGVISNTELEESDLNLQAQNLQTQLQEEIEQELIQEKQKLAVAAENVVLGTNSRLLLEFSKDSWVEVVDAKGTKLLYRLIKAPARRVVEGQAPFKVFLGNAPGVTLNYNGFPYDLTSYTDGDVAQLTIGKANDNPRKND